MSDEAQRERAARFLQLHRGPKILVLPNAWDAASARIFELAGFGAIGTTSGGIANSHGYPEPQRIPRDEMVAAVGQIVQAVAVPVSADIEAGYGSSPTAIAETVRATIEAGAVGINLEDSPGVDGSSLIEIAAQQDRIRAIRETARKVGVAIVINARTDVYLHAIGGRDARFGNAVARANAYREAGADSSFVPGVVDADLIGKLVRAINGPVNVLVQPGMPSSSELEKLGVARVSVGSGPMRAAMGLVRRIAIELHDEGTYTSILEGAIPYPELNHVLRR
ncbi:MAG TPA: isocitrate lyase/phosphoenolpyruvate mutase family protein [Candidatus Binataceae bacterium]